jgi:hypothetical protein
VTFGSKKAAKTTIINNQQDTSVLRLFSFSQMFLDSWNEDMVKPILKQFEIHPCTSLCFAISRQMLNIFKGLWIF